MPESIGHVWRFFVLVCGFSVDMMEIVSMGYEQPPNYYGQQQPYAPPPMQPQTGGPVEGYDWTIALILAIVVGAYGVDRFYTGSITLGILKLITLGGCGVWWLVDIIMIATGSYKDAYGRPLVRKP